MKDRERGWYWVEVYSKNQWMCAQYSANSDEWYIDGSWGWKDRHLISINEDRLIRVANASKEEIENF